MQITNAIERNETGGGNCNNVQGASKELGCHQFRESTYKQYAMETIGYVPPMTKINSKYVTAMKVQKWLDSGRTETQIFLAWNAGTNAKKCSKGTNKYGVKYDSCTYVAKGMKLLTNVAFAQE